MVRLAIREIRFQTPVEISDEEVDKFFVGLNAVIDANLQDAADDVIAQFRDRIPGFEYWMD